MKKADVVNFLVDNSIKSPNRIIRYNELSLKAGPSNSEKLIGMLTELIAEGTIIETENGGLRAREQVHAQ